MSHSRTMFIAEMNPLRGAGLAVPEEPQQQGLRGGAPRARTYVRGTLPSYRDCRCRRRTSGPGRSRSGVHKRVARKCSGSQIRRRSLCTQSSLSPKRAEQGVKKGVEADILPRPIYAESREGGRSRYFAPTDLRREQRREQRRGSGQNICSDRSTQRAEKGAE